MKQLPQRDDNGGKQYLQLCEDPSLVTLQHQSPLVFFKDTGHEIL